MRRGRAPWSAELGGFGGDLQGSTALTTLDKLAEQLARIRALVRVPKLGTDSAARFGRANQKREEQIEDRMDSRDPVTVRALAR